MTFYRFPFANDDSTKAIPPIESAGDDSVSFQEGYTVRYEEDPDNSGTARRIERDEFNGLTFSITTEIRQYQTNGVPEFITSAENGGSPFSYGINAKARLGNVIYQSLSATNTDTPPSANWLNISNPVTQSNLGSALSFNSLNNAGPVSRTSDFIAVYDTSENEARRINPNDFKNALSLTPFNGDEVNGNLNVQGFITATGSIFAGASDKRLKIELGKIDPILALDVITKTDNVFYQFTKEAEELSEGALNSEEVHIGFYTQNFEEVFPHLLSLAPLDNDNGKSKSGKNYQTMDYSKVVVLQASAMKAMRGIIDNQEHRISEIEEMLNLR